MSVVHKCFDTDLPTTQPRKQHIVWSLLYTLSKLCLSEYTDFVVEYYRSVPTKVKDFSYKLTEHTLLWNKRFINVQYKEQFTKHTNIFNFAKPKS